MRSSFGGDRRGSRRLSVVALSVALLAVPTPPALASDLVARDGSFSTRIEGWVGIPLFGLVDSVAPLTFTIMSGPSHGAVTNCDRYGCTYTPEAGFIGTDSLTFTANDGILTSNEATVTIEVTPNTVPVAVDFSITATSGKPFNFSSVGFDPDPPDSELQPEIVEGPSNGTLECFGYGCTYLSASGFVGTDVFTFTVTDGLATSNVATGTITVVPNSPPVANDIAVAGTFNQLVFFSLFATDVDHEFPDYEVVTPPAQGSVTCALWGGCTYTPTPGFVGVDSFTYRATDGQAFSNVATVTISVIPSIQPLSFDGYFTTRSGVSVVVSLSAVSEAPLTFAVTGGPSNGAVDDCSDGECTYTPALGFSGTDSFTFTAFDGWYTSNEATITILVALNNPPQVTDTQVTTFMDQAVEILFSSYDPDFDAVTIEIVGGPSHGSLDQCDGRTCLYTPAPGFVGTDQITFVADDGFERSEQATATIQVFQPNYPPVVSAGDDLVGAEGWFLTLEGSATDASGVSSWWTFEVLEGDPGAACYFSAPTSPVSEVWCTDDGEYLVTLNATDGEHWVADSAFLTLTNAPPVIGIGPLEDRYRVRTDFDVNVSIAEHGSNDSHSCQFDWGDGSSDTVPASSDGCGGTHSYARTGRWIVTVTVSDDDGGVATAQVVVKVGVPRRH